MTVDNVKCCNCDFDGLVERGTDTCPNCGFSGALSWKENEEQEIEVNWCEFLLITLNHC